MVIDFFEWKFHHRIVVLRSPINRLRDFLEMELAAALARDSEQAMKDLLF